MFIHFTTLPRRCLLLNSIPHLFISQFALICASNAFFWPSNLPLWKERQAANLSKKQLLERFEPINIDYRLGSKLAQLSNKGRLNGYLDNILIHRPVGSKGHAKVAKYLINKMQSLQFDVQVQNFTQYTVVGRMEFQNIIATKNPMANRRLVLACHYDSKLFKEFDFMGATDSAAPCAIMLDVAETLAPFFNLRIPDEDVTLQLIFFDGEEAFVDWSDHDSLYGSRKLAQEWFEKSYQENPASNNPLVKISTATSSELGRIDVMILLDLLGMPKSVTRIPNYEGTNFEPIYKALANVEQFLIKNGKMKAGNFEMLYNSFQHSIADDHLPFLQKNVNVVHLIPTPFPKVWHTKHDTRDFLDMATLEDWTSIMRLFTALYFKLEL